MPGADAAKASYQDWMKEQPDHVLLFQMSVPGTHDSAACEPLRQALAAAVLMGVGVFRQLHGRLGRILELSGKIDLTGFMTDED